MKNRIFGLLIFLFFIFGVIGMEGGSVELLVLPPFLITAGATAGLSLMYYKKGMDKNVFLKRVKKYFIFSGSIATFIAIIMILYFSDSSIPLQRWFTRISGGMHGIVYGFILAYITDTFIE